MTAAMRRIYEQIVGDDAGSFRHNDGLAPEVICQGAWKNAEVEGCEVCGKACVYHIANGFGRKNTVCNAPNSEL